MNKPILAAGLAFVFIASALLLSGPMVFANDDTTTSTNATTTENVEDVSAVNVNALPANQGKFELKGTISAVNASSTTVSVNGLAVNVANAKIVRGNSRTLADVQAGDRVEMSGRIESGALYASRVVVKGFGSVKILNNEAILKARSELNEKIQNILKQIEELRKQINSRLGTGNATSTQ